MDGMPELKREFDEFSPKLITALQKHVSKFAIGLVSYIAEHYLSGDPLHQRSGNLKRSLNFSPVETTEHSVSSTVGDNIEYAPQHELGLTVTVPAHERTIRMVFGRPVTPHEIFVRSHPATYPKRAFLVPGLTDQTDDFYAEMDAALAEAIDGTA